LTQGTGKEEKEKVTLACWQESKKEIFYHTVLFTISPNHFHSSSTPYRMLLAQLVYPLST